MDQAQMAALASRGATQIRDGRQCLNVPAFYPFAQSLASGEVRLDLKQSVDSDGNPPADFYLRGWKYLDIDDAGFTLLTRIRLLTGYYLSNVRMPFAQLNLRSVTPELRIPAGGFIPIEGENIDNVSHTLKIIFFGARRFYLDSQSWTQ